MIVSKCAAVARVQLEQDACINNCDPCYLCLQDYTYTELTSSVVKALVAFRRRWPSHRPERVSQLIAEGVQFVRDQQRDDGSFYGSWAVCFTCVSK